MRESKFNKSRYLPVHASTLDALERYTRQRDRLCPNPRDPSFFVSLRRRRLDDCAVHATFRRLCDATGVGADAPFPPRLHDLRHTMAVKTLLGWYREGVDVHSRLPALVDLPRAPEPRLHLLLPLGRTTSCSRTPPGCSTPPWRPRP